MRDFSKIGEELFNKLRGRFPSVTIGDGKGNVTNEPIAARYFDFDYKGIGKVSVNLDEKEGLTVIFSKDFAEGTSDTTKRKWYDFLKELRVFGKRRMLDFSVRDITKTNLDKRDYKFLATNRSGDDKMTESKLYGTSRVSYQKIGEARIMIKHTENINQELASGRTQKIGAIYIESAEGERFKYPYKHLAGARAMAVHVSEGGNAYDDFGKHIVSLSEELSKLRKFKTYMGRSAVMAESLAGYMDVVKERITTVKKTVESLQKPAYYKQAFESFESPVLEDVPSDVAENWIDQLTIKQFNEELKDVFPYIYKLVSEATKAQEIGPEDLLGEKAPTDMDCWDGYKKQGTKPGTGKNKGKRVNNCVPEEIALEQGFEEMMGIFGEASHDCDETCPKSCPDCGGTGDPEKWQAMQKEGAMKDQLIQAMEKIASDDSGELLYKALSKGAMGPDVQKYLQDMYDDVARDFGLHPDDDHDDIEERMWDQIQQDYGMGEGNAYANAVRQAKKDGKKKGDKIQGPDGDEITLEKDKKTPLGEFILSYYDRETGEFPKGETAVLTMVEKDYGEQFIEPAKAFIEKVNTTFEEFQMRQNPQSMEPDLEFVRMRELAGLR